MAVKIQLDLNDKPAAVSLFLEMHHCAKRWLPAIVRDVRFASENLATTVIRNLNAPRMLLEMQNFIQTCDCATGNPKLYAVLRIDS